MNDSSFSDFSWLRIEKSKTVKGIPDKTVSITNYGIYFSADLRPYLRRYVDVYISEDKKLIGIKPIESGSGFALSPTKKIHMNTRHNFEGYNISNGRYYAEWNEEEEMIIIDLVNYKRGGEIENGN